jgi:hypothetical protein
VQLEQGRTDMVSRRRSPRSARDRVPRRRGLHDGPGARHAHLAPQHR